MIMPFHFGAAFFFISVYEKNTVLTILTWTCTIREGLIYDIRGSGLKHASRTYALEEKSAAG
jgi:hypothetical protein